MNELRLIRVDLSSARQVEEYCASFGRSRERVTYSADRIPGLDHLEEYESVSDWLRFCQRMEGKISWYLSVRKPDGKIVGALCLRHSLEYDDDDPEFASHIGYSIRPDERGKGYAMRFLFWQIERDFGLDAFDGYVCPVMDARRAQVYNALFAANGGSLTRLTPDRAIALSDLAEELKNLDKPIFLVGDGSDLCYNTLAQSVPSLILPPSHRLHQRAVGVGLAALMRMEAGESPDSGSITPNYLRLSQAERERLERKNRP